MIKSSYRSSDADYDRMLKWKKRMLPEGNRLKDDFYTVKPMMKPLGLGYQKNNVSKLHVVQ
jgi:uncharacterized protein (DUF1501 family)